MTKLVLTGVLALCVGFLLGNLTGPWHGSPDPMEQGSAAAGTERQTLSPESPGATTPAKMASASDRKRAVEAAAGGGAQRGAGEAGPAHPGAGDGPPLFPPHVMDPHFFGPDPDDPETRRAREAALDDHLASLSESGASEAEIQAVREEFEYSVQTGEFVEVPSGPELSPEAEAADLEASLIEAGEPPEAVAEMVDDFWADRAADLEEQEAAVSGDWVLDEETGLDHELPSPPTPQHPD
jgi:hypothetical protein